MIGKENIEEKIFEYFEGDLNSSESKELENFIQDNPEYQVDFDAWKESTVKAEPMQYKFADELLVNERTSPKVWFKWASGGAFLFLISFASVGLINKYNGSKEKAAGLQTVDDQDLKVGSVEIKNAFNSENGGAFTGRNSEGLALSESVEVSTPSIISNKNLTKEEVSEKKILAITNNGRASSSKSQNKIGDSFNSSPNVELNGSETKDVDLVTELKEESNGNNNNGKLEETKSFNGTIISVVVLKEGKYSHKLPLAIIKARFKYENPNKPKFFVTNNKDPYLNYTLGHTLEENGSFAGNLNDGEGIRAEMLYRTEWPSVSQDNFNSTIFSLDSRVDNLKGGLGVMVNADRIGHGKLNSTAASLIYSPKIIVNNLSVEPSFKYTYNQKSISWNQVAENDVKDPRNGVLYASIPFTPEEVLKTRLIHHDLGLGMLINADKFFIGGQIDHLNQSTYSADFFDQNITVPTKISAMAGTDILKSKDGKVTFSPSLNYIKFGNYNTLWLNSQFSYQGFFFAGGLATNEELMASLGYGNNKVRIVYGLGFSKPSEFSGLEVSGKYYESHQLSLRVNLQPKKGN